MVTYPLILPLIFQIKFSSGRCWSLSERLKRTGEFEAKPHRKNDEKQKQILLFYSYVSLFSLSD